jgi:serine/threonine protein kinase
VDEFVYIIMEYADGPTLMEVMRVGKIEVRQGAELATEISDGLAAAHISGVVHRNPRTYFSTNRVGRTSLILDFDRPKASLSARYRMGLYRNGV